MEIAKISTQVSGSESNVQRTISTIAQLVADPNTDVEKIERLLDVQIKMMDRQAKIDYDHALARLQSKMPRITKKGEIKNKAGAVVAKYMKYEDIDLVIRPLMTEEGFSLKHDRSDVDGKMVVKTTLKHEGGHEETVSIPLPYDQPNALKSQIQAAVSTFSVGRRVNVCSLLDIVSEGEDDGGEQTHIKIDATQVAQIKNVLQKSGMSEESFLDYMGVEKIEDIPMASYGKASVALRPMIAQIKKSDQEGSSE